jgi:hypothetical protein
MGTTQRESAQPAAFAGSMYGVYVLSVAVCLIGNLVIRMAERGGWLPPSVRIAVGVGTAIPLAVAAGLFWRMLRQDPDEMLQRIALEGLAFALVVYVPLAGLYVNLRTAGAWTPRLDPPDILLTPAILVALGVALAWRRYR